MAPIEPTILHVDLDAFFAAVETLRNPALTGHPVIVGGLGARGVVSTANYEAREFGVHSAMAMAEARRRCPHAHYIAPHFEAYQAASQSVMTIFADYTPVVEPLSLDEAFLDVSGAGRVHGAPAEIARSIRARVRAETGLVASVGVATTKLCAKIASDVAKPDGLLIVESGREAEFLHALPVGRLWGVGSVTQGKLSMLSVETIGDLVALDPRVLAAALGARQANHLRALAANDDPRRVVPDREAKSIGAESTFASDLREDAAIDRELVRLSDRVARRLRARQVLARTVQLKVRFSDFHTVTRAHTLSHPTDVATELLAETRRLLAGVNTRGGVRLLGVSAAQITTETSIQPSLAFDDADAHDERRAALERAADAVRNRYGDRSVRPAALAPRRQQEGDTDP